MVDFSTGAVLVAIDFNRPIQAGTITRRTVEVLYLDREGRLRTRTRAADDASERMKQLEIEASQAEAAVASR
jgi:hypothetical protein